MSTPVDTLRRFYEAFENRDADAMRPLLEGCVWHVPGENLLAGEYRGPDEILGLFARARELSGGTVTFHVHDVVGDGEHAVGVDRVTVSRGARSVELNRLVIAHVREGALDEVWICPEDQYEFDEFWS